MTINKFFSLINKCFFILLVFFSFSLILKPVVKAEDNSKEEVLLDLKNRTDLKADYPVLLGKVVDDGTFYRQCPHSRYEYGKKCGGSSQCQGSPNYQIRWSQGSKTAMRESNVCWENLPRYTFEGNSKDNPVTDSDGEFVHISIKMSDQKVKLVSWRLETTDSQGNKLPNSLQTGYFSYPYYSQYFPVKVFKKDKYYLNHLWFFSNTPAKTCSLPIDIMIVQDGSGSISDGDFDRSKNFTRDLISYFNVGNPSINSRIGIVQFSTQVKLEIGLTSNANLINIALDSMIKMDDLTNITDGLTKAFEELRANGRIGSNKIIILLTDGYHNANDRSPVDIARIIKQENINIFIISVGNNVKIDQLKEIASDPDEKYLFPIADFPALRQILDDLVTNACQIYLITPTPIPTPTSKPTCPPESPSTETNPAAIDTYCKAATGKTCNAPNSWVSSLTCHSAPGWKHFGPSCHYPYCDGCKCVSRTPTPTPTPVSCPAKVITQETNSKSIDTYCKAATGKTCNAPNVWVSPLTCTPPLAGSPLDRIVIIHTVTAVNA